MINVLDIETYQKNNEVVPYCLSIKLNNEIVSFYEKDIIISCLNHIVSNYKSETVDIYIHNLNFDGILIIEEVTKKFIKFEVLSEKTNIYSITIYYCAKRIKLRCSYKIIPISLKKLGIMEKFHKNSFKYKFINEDTLYYKGSKPDLIYWENKDDYLNFKDETFDTQKYTITYCENDVELTYRVLCKLFNIIDNEDKKVRYKSLSSPSMSHKIFFKSYNIKKIEENLKLEYDNFIRSSFYGGRCETYGNRLDNEYIKYFDFSGMYAERMQEKFHCGSPKFENPKDFNKPGFYNITYMSKDNYLPVLPTHYNNKLIFSDGKKTDTFWFEEIQLFIEENKGSILKINTACLYDSYDYVFYDFVEKFKNIRKKEGYYNVFGKLMINSLYGGMALNNDNTTQYITFSEEEFLSMYKNTTVEIFYKINSCYILIIKDDFKFKKYLNKPILVDYTKRNVSYASAIASKARIKLYKSLSNVIKDGGRLLYTDTDSIFAAYDKKDKRSECLDFKWLDYYDDGVFIAPKTYALKSKEQEIIKIKGISEKNIDFYEIKNRFYNNEDIMFTNQLNFRKSDFKLRQYYIEKNINMSSYDKRKFINNKKETESLNIDTTN